MYLQMYYSLRVCVRNKRLASNNSQKYIHIHMTHKQLSYNHLEIPEIFPSSCAQLLMDYVFFIMCIQIYKYTYEHCWVMRRRIENLKIHATCCRDLYACCMPRRWSCSNYATAVKENIHNTCKEIYKQKISMNIFRTRAGRAEHWSLFIGCATLTCHKLKFLMPNFKCLCGGALACVLPALRQLRRALPYFLHFLALPSVTYCLVLRA